MWALRDGASAMNWDDVQQAKLTEEIGLEAAGRVHRGRAAHDRHPRGRSRRRSRTSSGTTASSRCCRSSSGRDALGLLAHSDDEERFTRARVGAARGSIQIAFGGMVAEELFFGEIGHRARRGDLVHATTIAAQMVGSFGMAGSLVSYEAVENGPISQGIVAKVLGNNDRRRVGGELLGQAKADDPTLLDDNRHLVIALRDELLAKSELVGDEIVDVLREAESRKRLDDGTAPESTPPA